MANEDAGRTRQREATEDEGRARAVGARKPGVVGKMTERCRETVESIRLPRPDWRTFAWGLLLLILVVFIVRNWAPLRINLFGWYLDAPRAVVLAIFFALGMITAWLIEVRNRRARTPEPEEPEEGSGEHGDEMLGRETGAQSVEPMPRAFAETRAVEEEEDTIEAEEDEPSLAAPDETAETTSEDMEEPSDASVVEEFGEAAEDDEDAQPHEDPLAVEDETIGDAFSDDYAFDAPTDDLTEPGVAEDDASAEDHDDWDADPDFEPAQDDDEDTEGGARIGGAETGSGDGPAWKFWAKGENES